MVLGAFKANATRQLREDGLCPYPSTPWADGGSKRRLWKEQSVSEAIDYVLYGQGDDHQTSAIDVNLSASVSAHPLPRGGTDLTGTAARA